MSRIDGPSGPGPISHHEDDGDQGVATVQAGEQKLSEVADRLGIDRQGLQVANPQISEGSTLKAGQEIRLPRRQEGDASQIGETASSASRQYIGETEKNLRRLGAATEGKEASPAPLTDPAVKDAVQSQLSAAMQTLSDADLAQLRGGAQTGAVQIQKDVSGKWAEMKYVKSAESKWSAEKGVADKWAARKDAGGGAGADKWLPGRSVADKWSPDKWVADKQLPIVDKPLTMADKQLPVADKQLPITDKQTPKDLAGVKQFEITPDVSVNKAKTADKANTQMDGYIRQ